MHSPEVNLPLNSSSRNVMATAIFLFLTMAAQAAPTVKIISPKSGSTSGSPVFYEATASSSTCASGIASMKIYSAPTVLAYTTPGAHLEAFITLSTGTYETTVETLDRCGEVTKAAIDITVSSTEGVSVYLPSSPSAESPVHIAASAQNSSCAGGIASMRIYTAPYVTPYTIDADQLDAYVTLSPGAYNLAVQAWDNCGNVFKSQLDENVRSATDGYLYSCNATVTNRNQQIKSFIVQLKIGSNGVLENPNGSSNPPEFGSCGSELNWIGNDPGGWFLYLWDGTSIRGFQIDQSTGALFKMPQSPFALNIQDIRGSAMDVAGHFLYASYGYQSAGTLASYRIDRSTGGLSLASTISIESPVGIATDPSGQYIYAYTLNGLLVGYAVDPSNGSFSPIPGNPYSFPSGTAATELVSSARYLYVGTAYDRGQKGEIFGFQIDSTTGALTPLPGSPFPAQKPSGLMQADWKTRYVWNWGETLNPTDSGIQAFQVAADTGSLSGSTYFTDLSQYGCVPATVEDPAALYVFTVYCYDSSNQENGAIGSWTIADTGDLKKSTVFEFHSEGVLAVIAPRKTAN